MRTKHFILGNWKSNKTLQEAERWKQSFEKSIPALSDKITVIVVPAFHHLPVFLKRSSDYALGAQDVSQFEPGSYTGAIAVGMLTGLVQYVMVGHSERRKHFGETDEIVAQKVLQVITHGLSPVVCVSDVLQVEKLVRLVPAFEATGILLYEPLFAVGSGTPDTPENANKQARKITHVVRIPVLYGGSVVPENVKSFMGQPDISGVGVGKASLESDIFASLIRAAVS